MIHVSRKSFLFVSTHGLKFSTIVSKIKAWSQKMFVSFVEISVFVWVFSTLCCRWPEKGSTNPIFRAKWRVGKKMRSSYFLRTRLDVDVLVGCCKFRCEKENLKENRSTIKRIGGQVFCQHPICLSSYKIRQQCSEYLFYCCYTRYSSSIK